MIIRVNFTVIRVKKIASQRHYVPKSLKNSFAICNFFCNFAAKT